MTEQILLDNDVILKVARYSLVDEMLAAIPADDATLGMLGVGRFVVRGRIERDRRLADPARALAAFEELLARTTLLEPTADEIALAAQLEAEASRVDLELDGGESQLVAMLACRACCLLITGDKRAVMAISEVARHLAEGRIACLEQLVAQIVARVGSARVRQAVCAEPTADRALALCLGCGREAQPSDEDVLAALASYSGDLGRTAPGTLLPGTDLSALAA